jgi:thermitase
MAHEYRVMGQLVRLEIDPNTVAVRFRPSAPRSLRAKAMKAAGLSTFDQRTEIPEEGITLVPASAGIGDATQRLNILAAQPDVVATMPVFKVGDNKVVASDRILAAFHSFTTAKEIISANALEIVRQHEKEFVLRVPPSKSSLEASRRMAEQLGVTYAEPDFITIGRHLPTFVRKAMNGATSDPLLPRQYAMVITQAKEAWAIAAGNPEVGIAILDEGVDVTHRDLAPAIAGTFDGIDCDTHQQPNPWDGHGTACAGLAAAVPEDGGGLRGVAAGCSILAVRIARSSAPDGDWVTTSETIRQSIDWSWQNGAAVLSNSWGGGAPSNAIVMAFERARTRGRGGLGSVIVISAGNASGNVAFPATIPSVLVVSASNEFDEFKTRTSRDRENWWGSCHGPEISVAAPGVHNLTTDITGPGGYDAGDYAAAFNGTSSATPLVAGACALVISAKPALREDQVRALIAETADKVGTTPYVQGRNDFFGFGRLNVLRAVQKARTMP